MIRPTRRGVGVGGGPRQRTGTAFLPFFFFFFFEELRAASPCGSQLRRRIRLDTAKAVRPVALVQVDYSSGK